MLSRSKKISSGDFKTLRQPLKTAHTENLSLSVYRGVESQGVQVAFVVSKKANKSAVKRNLLKRRGFESVKRVFETIKEPYFLVFHFKKGEKSLSFNDIDTQVKTLLRNTDVVS